MVNLDSRIGPLYDVAKFVRTRSCLNFPITRSLRNIGIAVLRVELLPVAAGLFGCWRCASGIEARHMRRIAALFAACISLCLAARADTVILSEGASYTGQFVGTAIHFTDQQGIQHTFPRVDVQTLVSMPHPTR